MAACNGFDADQASAYLENALGKTLRADFELHLSGCAPCRGHLIALSRLMPESEAVITPAREAAAGDRSRWVEIREWLAQWFDLREWRWDWQTMGMAGAAAAILILALVAQPWRASQSGESLVGSSVPAAALPVEAQSSSGGAGDSLAARTPNENEAQPAPSPQGAANALRDEDGKGGRIPVPEVTPQSGMGLASREIASSSDLSKKMSLQSMPVGPVGGAASQSLPAAPPAPSENFNFKEAPQAISSQAIQVPAPAVVANLDAAPEEPSRLGPSPEDNPMRTISTGGAAKRRGRQPEREISSAKPSWIDRAMAFAPARKASDKDAKPLPQAADEETARFLIVRIHNRVFRFEDGTWIDQEYKPEMQWRVTKLVHGSDEFQRILEQEPQLKPYFDKRSIIVVWRDKIYKVTGK